MQRYVAFLRAINVGGRRTVKMDRLRTVFESLALDDVETFIASGNVIFSAASQGAPALEERIEQRLRQTLGYEVATFVRSAAELADIAAHQPFGELDPTLAGHALSIAFLKAVPTDDAQRKLMGLRTEVDDFHVYRREAYWLCRTRVSESTFSGALLEKTLGMPATVRNVTTVRKLRAKYAGPHGPR